MASAAFAAAVVAGAALVSFAPAANAVPYTFDVTTLSGKVLVLDITAANADSVLVPGYDITAVTGTVNGVSVSSYTGVWGPNGDQVSSGLYLDPYLNQNPGHIDGNGTNVFVVQNPPGSGGFNVNIDNIYYTGANNLSYQGGFALLLSNGATYYVSANGDPGNSGVGSGGYYDILGGQSAFSGGGGQGATPLPAALPLFATGLGALGLLGWRRKRKNAAAIA